MLVALLIGSLNYDTSLGYGATFLLAGLGITGMIRTYTNLLGLELRVGPAPAVFAGGSARFPVNLDPGRRDRWAVAVRDTVETTLPAGTPRPAVVSVPAPVRGRLALPRSVVRTTWPLELFRVWSWVWPRSETIVYPRPFDHGHPLPSQRTAGTEASRSRAGDEEFAGLREYRAGDPTRRIAWKTFARTDELHTKSFDTDDAGDRVLDWYELAGLGTEQRLEQMTHWVLQAEARDEPYALHLPAVAIDADRGERHRRRCLEALALHGESSAR